MGSTSVTPINVVKNHELMKSEYKRILFHPATKILSEGVRALRKDTCNGGYGG